MLYSKNSLQFRDTIKVVLKRWIYIEKKYSMGQVSGKNLHRKKKNGHQEMIDNSFFLNSWGIIV